MSEKKLKPEDVLKLYEIGKLYYTSSTGITENDLSREPRHMTPVDNLVVIPSAPGTNLTVKNYNVYRSIIVSIDAVNIMSKKYNVAIYTEQDKSCDEFNFYVLLLRSDYLVINLNVTGPDAIQTVGEKNEIIRRIANHEIVIYEPYSSDKSNNLFIRKSCKIELPKNRIFLSVNDNQQLCVSYNGSSSN